MQIAAYLDDHYVEPHVLTGDRDDRGRISAQPVTSACLAATPLERLP